jgi:hypothetical protein
MVLSAAEVKALKKVIDYAITHDVTATALLTIPGAAALPREAQDLLKSITQGQLNSPIALYKKAMRHASQQALRRYGPIH